MTGRSARLGSVAFVVVGVMAALFAVTAPAQAEDITPPVLTAFSMSPDHVDTTSAAQTITVSFAIDDPSGVEDPQVSLFSPDRRRSIEFALKRVSDDAVHGVYTGTAVMPKGSEAGTWNAWVVAFDTLRNLVSAPWADIDATFGPGVSEVINDATVCDTTPPQVAAVSITPSHIDTSAAEQRVDVSLRVTDDLSGVSFVGGILVGPGHIQGRGFSLALASGDATDGVYEGSVTLPRWSAAGTWTLTVHTFDVVGNATIPLDLSERFGTAAQTTNDAIVSDTTPPLLTSLSLTPAEFDAETGDQRLTVTATMTDDLTGTSDPIVEIRPMLSDQYLYAELKLTAGDRINGTYSGTITVPQGSEVGLWQTDVQAMDEVRNKIGYTTEQLSALFPDAPGVILANTAQADQVTIRKEWTLSGGESTVTFPAGTVVTRKEGGRFAFYKMTAEPFTFSADVPTEDLQGIAVATLRFGIPGLDLSFSQPVTVRMRVGDTYDGYLVHIQSLVEGGESWANETEAEVLDGQVRFTVNHATRFAASAAPAQAGSLSPRRGKRNRTVTITGRGFGKTRGRSVVLFGGKVCKRYGAWSPTKVTFRVPPTARPGRYAVSVRVNGLTTRVSRFTVRR